MQAGFSNFQGRCIVEKLESVDTLVVRQRKEWSEILTGFEARNSYEIMDASGQVLYTAAELEGSFWTRVLLKALRPFTIYIMEPGGGRVLILDRPFTFYLHRLEILDPNMKSLGPIQRRFSILRRKYSVLDELGTEVFQLFGPILHPWTFMIRIGDRDVGKITKKWSGFLKEAFTKADNFGITFPVGTDLIRKSLLLGAVFLIDFVHFERSSNQ
jgi:uncharacterized protein YxjI